MAGITAPGVGSGLDIAGLVQQLVSAERAPHSLRLNRAESKNNVRISSLGKIRSGLDALKGAADTLQKLEPFGARKTTVSDTDRLTATASSDAPLGKYSVEVQALASAHRLMSGALDKDAGIGAGRLSVQVGGKTFAVDIDASDKPADIVSAFNTAAEAAGAKVRASLSTSDTGQHLVFSATETGVANKIKVTRASGDVALDALVYDPPGLASLTQTSAAQDALILVDDTISRTSSTNKFDDVVPGFTIDVKKAEAGEKVQVTVANDSSAVSGAVRALVDKYNALIGTINAETKYDADNDQASTLTGDAMANGIRNQLRSAVYEGLGFFGSQGLSAKESGLDTRVDGTLSFDATKFDAALAAKPDAVKQALTGAGGMVDRLSALLADQTGDDSPIAERIDSLKKQNKRIKNQREDLDDRMERVEARYRAQFTAMDTLVAQLNQTSQFLAQRLAPQS